MERLLLIEFFESHSYLVEISLTAHLPLKVFRPSGKFGHLGFQVCGVLWLWIRHFTHTAVGHPDDLYALIAVGDTPPRQVVAGLNCGVTVIHIVGDRFHSRRRMAENPCQPFTAERTVAGSEMVFALEQVEFCVAPQCDERVDEVLDLSGI